MHSIQGIQEIKTQYAEKKSMIQERLGHFQKFYHEPYTWHYSDGDIHLKPANKSHDERIFEELCFCIFTANTSAEMGAKSIDAVRDLLIAGTPLEMKQRLEGIYRFKNLRPMYIIHTREFLRSRCGFKLKDFLESYDDKIALRDFFALSKDIKGLGMKESSHFLRNIGFKGYAILDKHIINSLNEFAVLKTSNKPKNRNEYLEIESKFREFSEKIGIDMDEMDLLLWSRKTGKILK